MSTAAASEALLAPLQGDPAALDAAGQALEALQAAGVGWSTRQAFAQAAVPLSALVSPRDLRALAEPFATPAGPLRDAALASRVLDATAALATHWLRAGGLAAWLEALAETARQDPACIGALLEAAPTVLVSSTPQGLLAWTRAGLAGALAATTRERLAHFGLRTPVSVALAGLDARQEGREPVELASVRRPLGFWLRALWDDAPSLHGVPPAIAQPRPFLSNLGIHLPQLRAVPAGSASGGLTARRWYYAATAHAAAHRAFTVHRFERGELKPVQLALIGLLEDARIERLAMDRMPGLAALWASHHEADATHGDAFAALAARLARALFDPAWRDAHSWIAKALELWNAPGPSGRPAVLDDPAALRRIASLLGNDIGQMRVRFDFKSYVVEPGYRDDNACIWADAPQDAQAMLSLSEAVAVQASGSGTDTVDGGEDASLPARPVSAAEPQPGDDQAASVAVEYPEWDRLIELYRPRFARVIEMPAEPDDPVALQAALERHAPLVARLDALVRGSRVARPVRRRGQPEGDALDVDAAVRAAIDLRCGRTPDLRAYWRTEHRQRDVAVSMLLDLSHSTSERAPDGRTGLDLAREAALLAATAMQAGGDRCAIDGFCSDGREEVRYYRFKRADSPLDEAVLSRLAGARSHLSTRMGAAIRHATASLARERAQTRLLLLVTDGEPHDIDVHDRRYLVEDARKAVLEAGSHGIHAFCVTTDRDADAYVSRIFGEHGWRVLDRIEQLPLVLPALYLRMTR